MSKMPRIVWEILALVVLAALGYGFWTWSDFRWQQRMASVEKELQAELEGERRKTETQLAQRRAAEGEVVGRAFAAGIRGALAGGRTEAVDAAVGELLRIPGVLFAHVLERDGSVIATSDRKLVTTGQAGPRAEWALTSQVAVSRAGAGTETTEVAIPLGSQADAVLWIGYEITQATSPASANPASDAAAPAPEPESSPDVPTEGEPV